MRAIKELTVGALIKVFEDTFALDQNPLTRAINSAYKRHMFDLKDTCPERYEVELKRLFPRNPNPSDIPYTDWPELSASTLSHHKSGKSKKSKSPFLKAEVWWVLWNDLTALQDDTVMAARVYTELLKENYDLSLYKNQLSENGDSFLRREFADAFIREIIACAFAPKKQPAETTKQAQATPEHPNTSMSSAPSDPAVIPATYRPLLQHGWTKKTIAEALVAGDEENYDELDPANEGHPRLWQEFLSSYAESFQYLVTEDFKEIVGNFSFLSLSPAQEELALQGLLFQASLSPEKTLDLNAPGADHVLFLLNLDLRDPFSSAERHIMLRTMFLKQLLRYAENGVFFKKMLAHSHRKAGDAFLTSWGFDYVIDNALSGRIFALDMLPFPARLDEALKKMPAEVQPIRERLKTLYNNVYVSDDVNDQKAHQFVSPEQTSEEIEALLENAVYTGDTMFLSERIDALPLNRAAAVTLLKMSEAFDGCGEIYDALFYTYRSLLTEDELSALAQRASRVWDSEILEWWGIGLEK